MLRFELYQEVKVTEQVGSEIRFTTALKLRCRLVDVT
jgi:hypothetical protein